MKLSLTPEYIGLNVVLPTLIRSRIPGCCLVSRL